MPPNISKGAQQPNYYYSIDGETYGPFTVSDLLPLIEADTLVYREGIEWTPASDVEELKKFFKSIDTLPIAKPSIEKAPSQSTITNSPIPSSASLSSANLTASPTTTTVNAASASDSNSSDKRNKAYGIIGLAVILIAYYSYTKKEDDKSTVDQTTYQQPVETPPATSYTQPAPSPSSPSNDAQSVPDYNSATSTPETLYGYYPEASTRLLTEDDVQNLTAEELRIMRNEIFARHGYIFKTASLSEYFASQDWYTPTYNNVDEFLTDIEKQNIRFIKAHE
jgi:hypothetical protein